MIEHSAPYILREDNQGIPAGTVLFKLAYQDYGLASDDTRSTGIPHVSMTVNPTGDYPGRTFPETLLLKPIDFVHYLGTEEVAMEYCITRGLVQGLMELPNARTEAFVQAFLDGSRECFVADPIPLVAYIRKGALAELRVFLDNRLVGKVHLQRGLGPNIITSYEAIEQKEVFDGLMSTGLQVARAFKQEAILAAETPVKEEDLGITADEQAAIGILRSRGYTVTKDD